MDMPLFSTADDDDDDDDDDVDDLLWSSKKKTTASAIETMPMATEASMAVQPSSAVSSVTDVSLFSAVSASQLNGDATAQHHQNGASLSGDNDSVASAPKTVLLDEKDIINNDDELRSISSVSSVGGHDLDDEKLEHLVAVHCAGDLVNRVLHAMASVSSEEEMPYDVPKLVRPAF